MQKNGYKEATVLHLREKLSSSPVVLAETQTKLEGSARMHRSVSHSTEGKKKNLLCFSQLMA